MKFLSHFAGKSYGNLKKKRGTALAVLAAIALLFAAQSQSTRAQDDDSHEATAIIDCGTVISQPGRYFLANDLKNCPGSGISITVGDVRVELRGHTIQQAGVGGGVPANVIDANGGTTGLSNLEIEGPGTITGGQVGISFGNVHRSRVHNLVVVENNFGVAVNGSDLTTDATAAATASTDNDFRDNVVTSNLFHGITVNGGNENRFIHNNLSGNSSNGLLLFNAKNNVVRNNTADSNFESGIDIGALGSGNLLDDNTALGNNINLNGQFDLTDENVNCDHNTWTNNSFNSKSSDCIQ